jgi:hypothetical protein
VPEQGRFPHPGREIAGINGVTPGWANFFLRPTKLTSQLKILHNNENRNVHYEYNVAIELYRMFL